MEQLRNIYKLIVDLLFLAVIVYGLIFVPELVGYKATVVNSSAEDIPYSVGTVVYYKNVSSYEIKEGNMIIYKPADEYIIHRVNSVDGEVYLTDPDQYNTSNPNRIEYSNVSGKIADLVLPVMGNYVNFISSHIFIVYLAVILFIVDIILDKFKVFAKKDKNKFM